MSHAASKIFSHYETNLEIHGQTLTIRALVTMSCLTESQIQHSRSSATPMSLWSTNQGIQIRAKKSAEQGVESKQAAQRKEKSQ